MPLQIRRGTAAERTGLTTPLVIGELLYVTDQGRLYIGDGTNLGAADSAGNPSQGGKGLSITGFTAEDAQDAAAILFSNGTHTNIIFTYNDGADALSAQIDLSTYTGNITVVNGIVDADFRGSVFADNSTLLVDAVNGSIPYAVLNGAPTQVSQFANDVGYITVADISDGTVTIDVNNTGDLQGSVFGDDSTLLVDATNSTIPASVVTGTFAGNVTGDVVGVVTGQSGSSLVGNVTGNVFGNVFGDSDGFHTGDVKGSVFADDSSLLIDAVAGKIVGNIENDLVNSVIITLQGITGTGEYAGLIIKTEEDLNAPFDYLTLVAANNGADGPAMMFIRSRGTLQVPTVSIKDDMIMSQFWLGAKLDGTTEVAAAISVYVDDDPGASSVPGRFEFSTVDNAGALNVALSLDKDGVIGIRDNSLLVGVASGEVDIGGAIKYVKVTVGGVDYALAMYPLNP